VDNVHTFGNKSAKKYALTPQLRFKQLACDKCSAANLFRFPVIKQKNFVMSGYKHVGIWHVLFTCRYPYAFV